MHEISILIVDDEAFVCDSLVLKIGMLRHSRAYITTCCNSANQALQLAKVNTYDLVITDIRMPFVSGLSLIKSLRAETKVNRIVVMSGYSDFDYVRQAFLNGADDYILKPIAVSELDEKFNSIFSDPQRTAVANDTDETPPGKEYDRVIDYALEYIHTHYSATTLSMNEVAQHVSLSYSHFSYLFRKETGCTFPVYLRQYRIKKSIELLDDPALKINEVCQRVGFKYPQQFSSDFKRITGFYPSEYLAAHKDTDEI